MCFQTVTRLQRGFVFALLMLAFSVYASAGAKNQKSSGSNPAPQDSGQYIGSNTCQGCHDEIYKGFEASPHFATTKPSKMAPGGHGCESCHGPGAAHVEGGGDKTKIFRFTAASPEQINQRCMSCHQQNQERANFSRSAHATNGVPCTSCHSPHHAREPQALLVDFTPSLCYSCHTDKKADFAKPFHHRVNEGLIKCQDCHNPHGGYVRRQLRQTASQQEVCFKCHRDKQGPFVFEHPPVKEEGCTTCHTPHGSVNPRLLRVTPVNVLCMQCHSPARPNSATPAIPNFHNQFLKYQTCTMCHPAIHGSNAVETFEF
jgi:DmsE family decaheme c-type cytochrome